MKTFYATLGVDDNYLKDYFKEFSSYGHWYSGYIPDEMPKVGDLAELRSTDGVIRLCTVTESNGLRVSLRPLTK